MDLEMDFDIQVTDRLFFLPRAISREIRTFKMQRIITIYTNKKH